MKKTMCQVIGSRGVPIQHSSSCWALLTPGGRFDWIINRTVAPECTCWAWRQTSPCLSFSLYLPVQFSTWPSKYHKLGLQSLTSRSGRLVSRSLRVISHILHPFRYKYFQNDRYWLVQSSCKLPTCTAEILQMVFRLVRHMHVCTHTYTHSL